VLNGAVPRLDALFPNPRGDVKSSLSARTCCHRRRTVVAWSGDIT
jgi:hypothetical protein